MILAAYWNVGLDISSCAVETIGAEQPGQNGGQASVFPGSFHVSVKDQSLSLKTSCLLYSIGATSDKAPTRLKPCALRSSSNRFILTTEPAATRIIVSYPISSLNCVTHGAQGRLGRRTR